MTEQLSPEANELIKIIQKDQWSNDDKKKFQELILKNIGNMSLNSSLIELSKKLPPDSVQKNLIDWLAKFTYKTKDFDKIPTLLDKLNLITKLREEGLEVADFEKLTLYEVGILDKVSNFSEDEKLTEFAKNNKEFQSFKNKIDFAKEAIETLEKSAIKQDQYKAGDVMMYLTEKTVALKERQNLSGHEGKLEQTFITQYNHAAPIFIKDGKATKSDIWQEQRVDNVTLYEVLESNIFRIDPTKLVNINIAQKLAQVDYGTKADSTKITWQDVMRERYEQLSQAVHDGLVTTRSEVLNGELTELSKGIEDKINDMNAEQKKFFEEIENLEKQIYELRKRRETPEEVSLKKN